MGPCEGRLSGAPCLVRKPVISYDGSTIAVIDRSTSTSSPRYIHISTDGGATFVPQTGPGASGQAYWMDIRIQSQQLRKRGS